MNVPLQKQTAGLILTLGFSLGIMGMLGLSPMDREPDSPLPSPYSIPSPVLDIAATPDGTILVAAMPNVIHQIREGSESTIIEIPVAAGVLANGLESVDDDRFYVATGGLDLALGAGIWEVANGEARLLADIHRFETEHDPDAWAGAQWKHPSCEDDTLMGFTAGPQSNPYRLARLPSETLLVADAAGNTLLASDTEGNVDWVAVFEPPLDNEGEWGFLRQAEKNAEIDCYIQPVPSAVAVGPDGAYYVGDLTGIPAALGWSKVWRIAPGQHHVTCPSEACAAVVTGLSSVVDLDFGPDGQLYVVELDRNGWLAASTGNAAGGRISRCDTESGACDVVYESNLSIPAITFDSANRLWVAENTVLLGDGTATVQVISVE